MSPSTLQKLLKKPPPPSTTKILASLHHTHQTPPIPFALHDQIPQLEPKPTETVTTFKDCNFFGQFRAANSTHFDLSVFSPISPIGLFSYPILTTGSVLDRPEEDGSGGAGLWADSVKKKRKKKMNKHKYKKLRKRLRRQS